MCLTARGVAATGQISRAQSPRKRGARASFIMAKIERFRLKQVCIFSLHVRPTQGWIIQPVCSLGGVVPCRVRVPSTLQLGQTGLERHRRKSSSRVRVCQQVDGQRRRVCMLEARIDGASDRGTVAVAREALRSTQANTRDPYAFQAHVRLCISLSPCARPVGQEKATFCVRSGVVGGLKAWAGRLGRELV